ncbi:MAG: ATP-binding cassette domain-containing protein [Gemmatimonadaceae bacterium]
MTIAEGPAALEARQVSLRYRDVAALDNVALSIDAGQTVALVGESGAGKTTLLRCFNRLVQPDTGEILIDGVDVRARSPYEVRRHTGYVPQQGGLLPHWRVLRNVALVPTLLGRPDATAAAEQALALAGLPAARFAMRYPHELSGGERQRAALARALAARPAVVLLDEPFGALDAITRSDLQESFLELRRTLAFTTLLVTHDLSEAARLADRIVVMRAGRVEQAGTLDELLGAPASEYVASLLERALAAVERLRTRT